MSVVRGSGEGSTDGYIAKSGTATSQPNGLGQYRFNDESDDQRNRASCRIVDISSLGAGIDLFDTTSAEALDQAGARYLRLARTCPERSRSGTRRGYFAPASSSRTNTRGTFADLGMRW